MNNSYDLYNVEYYASHCGTMPYERTEHWLNFFGQVADEIIRHIHPKTVFDAGCAHGFLVESLWDRGVHTKGRDLSDFAISQIRDDMVPYCKVGSITESFDGPYDLVTCIEVIEHIPEEEALMAIDAMTAATSTILFSSSPTDLTEPTHVNVKPPIYWLMRFAERGFEPDALIDASFLSPQAFVLRKTDKRPSNQYLQLFAQWIRLKMALVDRDQRLGLLQHEREELSARSAAVSQADLDGEELAVSDHTDSALMELTERTLDAARAMQRKIELHNKAAEGSSSQTSIDPEPVDYREWCRANEPSSEALNLQRRMADGFVHKPLFSVIVPVYRVDVALIDELIDSVRAQTYPYWELCFAIGDSLRTDLVERIAAASDDPRIKYSVLSENGGIARNSNAALELATGDWAVLLDHDDTIAPDALFEFVRALTEDPDIDFIYSDKDQIDLHNTRRMYPLFKPRWSPEMMLNANYLTHFSAMRLDRMREIGGWDPETDGAQDWDIFLRVIGESGKVKHIPRVLYHWRQAPTSVSAGGLAAKPYAASGQLRTVAKYLQSSGWAGAAPDLDRIDMHVNWSHTWRPSTSVVVYNAASIPLETLELIKRRKFELLYTSDQKPLAQAIDDAIEHASGEVIIVLDGRAVPQDGETLTELIGPLQNKSIAIVGGQTIDAESRIVDFGMVFPGGSGEALFRGEGSTHFGLFGGAGWYRNALATSGACLAFRRSLWEEIGGFQVGEPGLRTDIQFCLRATLQRKGRLMLNPYASFRVPGLSAFEQERPGRINYSIIRAALPDGDPFFNPRLGIDSHGRVQLAQPAKPNAHTHDYAAEARGVTSYFDFTSQEVRQSIERCEESKARPLRSMAWFVPAFDNPFYGGLLTIFRVADYALRVHGVRQTIVVVGGIAPYIYANHIRRAFPSLADGAEIISMPRLDEVPDLEVDAAIATLWITALPVMRLQRAHRKFHFLQDWEPLFYPAGSLSAMVESTYRFGFNAVTNTASLAESYRFFGGNAEHFLPSVDTSIFHNRRPPVPRDGPVVIFCYARPGHPRNGFEVLMAAFKDLKERYGDWVDLVTAGADWNPGDYDLVGVIRHLGLLSYPETGALYRAVDIGVVAMATRHPSYLPFELMACGALVATNRNPYTTWLLKENENCVLFETVRSDVVDVLSKAIDDATLRRGLADAGSATVSARHSHWDRSCEMAFDAFRKVVEE